MKKYYYKSRKVFREGTLEIQGGIKLKFPKQIFGYCPVWKRKKDALKIISAEFIDRVELDLEDKK